MVIQRLTSSGQPVDVADAAAAIGWSSFSKDPKRLLALAEDFLGQPDKALYVALEDGRLVGLVAAERCASPTITISRIGVHPERRGRGIGSAMVHHLASAHPEALLEAETDSDALGFYRKLGFRISSLGEKYRGIERFLCTLDPLRDRPPQGRTQSGGPSATA